MHDDWRRTTDDALLLLEEVAREARVSVSTVRFWIAVGKLESVRPGRRRLVRRGDLDAFIAATTSPADRRRRMRRRISTLVEPHHVPPSVEAGTTGVEFHHGDGLERGDKNGGES